MQYSEQKPLIIKNIRDARYKIESLREQITRLRSAMEVGAQRLKLVPGGHEVRNKLEEDMAKLDEMERRLVDEIISLQVDIQAAEARLNILTEAERIVMRLRYVDGCSWRKVSRKSGYSLDHCFTIHRRALCKLNSK